MNIPITCNFKLNDNCKLIYDILEPRRKILITTNKNKEYSDISDAIHMIYGISDFLEMNTDLKLNLYKAFNNKNATDIIYCIKRLKGESKDDVINLRKRVQDIMKVIMNDVTTKAKLI